MEAINGVKLWIRERVEFLEQVAVFLVRLKPCIALTHLSRLELIKWLNDTLRLIGKHLLAHGSESLVVEEAWLDLGLRAPELMVVFALLIDGLLVVSVEVEG